MLTKVGAQHLDCGTGIGRVAGVATMLHGSLIRDAIAQNTFIVGGDPTSVEAVKYDFHLGDRVLKAEYGQPKEISAIPEEKRLIAPGETVFVLTRERLALPRDMIAVLVPKRKMAHGGISILGGLSVDPEYKGVLVVGMHNFSSSPYHLRPGKKLIAAIFYKLSPDELVAFTVAPPNEITDFPDDLVDLISKYKPVELGGLQEALAATRRELQELKADLSSDKTWRDEFKIGLNELKQGLMETNRNLVQLGSNLEKESTLRAQEDRAITGRLDRMSNLFFGLRLGWAALAALLIAVLGAVVGHYVPLWLGH